MDIPCRNDVVLHKHKIAHGKRCVYTYCFRKTPRLSISFECYFFCEKHEDIQIILQLSECLSATNIYNLIFFVFICFPVVLLVKTMDSYLHEFCAQGIYIAIFSNMAQHQRARYRVACYIIVNVTTATLESKMKNAWKRHWQKRNGNSLNRLYLGISNSFKDGSSKLTNHSAHSELLGQFRESDLGCITLDFMMTS